MVDRHCYSIKSDQKYYRKFWLVASCLYCSFCLPTLSIDRHLGIFISILSEVRLQVGTKAIIKGGQRLAKQWIITANARATSDAIETWPIAEVILELSQFKTEEVVTWRVTKGYNSFHFIIAVRGLVRINRITFQTRLSFIHCFLLAINFSFLRFWELRFS